MTYSIPRELLWLIAIVTSAALVEFSVIEVFDLNPILSIKIQGFLGLMILGYGIRMTARFINGDQDTKKPKPNGKELLE